MFINGIVMDGKPNRNGRVYTSKALVEASKSACGKKLYTNIVPKSVPLPENEIGEIIGTSIEGTGASTKLRITCVVDTSKPGWNMVLEPFVMVPDGDAVFDSSGVVHDFSLSCVALAPRELGAFPSATLTVIEAPK